MISEREWINMVRRYAGNHGKNDLIKGIGDDCAVLRKNETHCILLTTDTLVEGVHFDLNWHSPYLLGRKSVSVNLSDIAAMGGQPEVCLLSVAFPEAVPVWFEDFMAGFTDVLNTYDTRLVGGDTVKGHNDLVISVTLIGAGPRQQICYRSGAQPGDLVWVSGPLGNSAAGLELCRRGLYKPDGSEGKWQQLIKAHLDPEPQVSLGKVLAASGCVRAMMDISDGLATDLAHICTESGVGAEIQLDLVPISDQLEKAAAALEVKALDLALKGGEDYQLLFTTKAADEQMVLQIIAEQTGRKAFVIGRITEGQGVYLRDNLKSQEISYQGYDHFTD